METVECQKLVFELMTLRDDLSALAYAHYRAVQGLGLTEPVEIEEWYPRSARWADMKRAVDAHRRFSQLLEEAVGGAFPNYWKRR